VRGEGSVLNDRTGAEKKKNFSKNAVVLYANGITGQVDLMRSNSGLHKAQGEQERESRRKLTE